MRNMSSIGALVNHLWPCRRYSPWSLVGDAVVTFARPSDPPCFSVIAIAASRPALSAGRRSPKSYTRDARPLVHCLASASSLFSAGTAAYVIVIGQAWPGSTAVQAT